MISQMTMDFAQSLVDAKILAPETMENEVALDTIQQIIGMTEQEVIKENSSTVYLIHREFSDWIETYEGQK